MNGNGTDLILRLAVEVETLKKELERVRKDNERLSRQIGEIEEYHFDNFEIFQTLKFEVEKIKEHLDLD